MPDPLGLIGDRIAFDRHGNRIVSRSNSSVNVGTAVETDTPVRIGFKERCGGLYILGQPRTGKSNLLIDLALSDIRSNYGILFIDPHTDAINDLLGRIPENRRKDIVLLDPTDKEYSFGINLLHCRDRTNGIELDHACGRVRDIFVKVWGDDRGQIGVWLDKIIRNTVYLLLENTGYTLYDLPPLLWEDATFRNELLKKVRVKTGVKDFWYNEFDRLTKRERTEQVGPAQSRLDIFRSNSMIRDIVGQVNSTIDFGQMLQERKIILLRLPVNLTGEVKTLIGTIVLSEVLYAVFEREKVPESQREYFGIYCDEFQEFATPDFARLFTQTGKYKVMPVVAHQTRLGQFKPGDPNQGATLASPNKVLFTLSAADAKELALEFAKEPPTEIAYEQRVVISHEPIKELLTGRHKPEIQAFVDRYLRHLQWRREDTKEEIERERLLRLSDMDEAALSRVDERMESVDRHVTSQIGALKKQGKALQRVQARTYNLFVLLDASNQLRLTFRGLNTFLIEVMEGKKKPGQEAFSDFLVTLAENNTRLTEIEKDILDLYIRLSYGDPRYARAIPYKLCRAYGLFPREAALLSDQARKETRDKREEFTKKYMSKWLGLMADQMRWYAEARSKEREKEERRLWWALGHLLSDCFGIEPKACWESAAQPPFMFVEMDMRVYTAYVWYHFYFQEYLAPFTRAKFASRYAKRWDITAEKVEKLIDNILEKLTGERKASSYREWFNSLTVKRELTIFQECLLPDICRALKKFLYTYQEGALIILSLISGRFIEIEGYDPVDVWVSIGTLCGVMNKKYKEANFINDEFTSHFNVEPYYRKRMADFPNEGEKWLRSYGFLREHRWAPVWYDYQKDCELVETPLQTHWAWFSAQYPKAARCWKNLGELPRTYLVCRAVLPDRSDLKYFDGGNLPASTNPEYEALVEALRALLQYDRKRREEEERKTDEKDEAQRRQRIENDCRCLARDIVAPPCPYLKPPALSASELRAVKRACAKELAADNRTKEVAATIIEFAAFCQLLSKPENHLGVKGPYTQKQVRTRTEIDMVNEIARLFTDLPRYTAYAKIIEEERGEPRVWKGRIRTAKLADAREDEAAETRRFVLAHIKDYCQPRRRIQEEIDRRQKKWRVHDPDAPLTSVKQPQASGARSGTQSTKPPTRTRGPLSKDR